ncbi:hypothetical protein [Calidithermus chliarophilus]|uniref:hypothetical protein n=1 Tax=Calidithermus chliarophilus TaxID=52023 RepID=UPI0012F6C317|nr:hypothetical protein [Calidithermus chliarophilus]
MHIEIDYNSDAVVQGIPWYNDEDISIGFKLEMPLRSSAASSVLVNFLQVMVDIDGRALYVEGVTHPSSWLLTDASPSSTHKGTLRFIYAFQPGVSVRLTGPAEWPQYINLRDRWFCIGDREIKSDDIPIEFASNTVAIIRSRHLVGLWIKLDNLPRSLGG